MSEDTKPKAAPKKNWKVIAEFWDGPHLKAVGDTVSKTDAEVQYMTPHILVPVKAEVEPPVKVETDPPVAEEPETPVEPKNGSKSTKSKR